MTASFFETGLYVLGAVLLPVIGVLLVCFGVWGDRSKRRPRCPECWYDMRGTLPRLECPECGHNAREELWLYQDRRDWRRIVLGAVLLLVSSCPLAVTISRMAASGPPNTLTYWYDMKTGKLYGAPGPNLSPMLAPSGGEGVKAAVYAEKDCADPKDRFAVYLWKFPPPGGPAAAILIKTPDEDEWVFRSDGERYELVAVAEAERGVKLTRCRKYE